jgi:thioredoxin 1
MAEAGLRSENLRNKIMATFSELINAETPVLVDFSAEWCGPCKMMAPILQELKSRMGDKIRILKIDVDRNPALAQQYRVQGVPTLMVFSRGTLRWRQSGVIQAADLESIISQQLSV